MKAIPHQREQASAVLITLLTTTIIGIVLGSYLVLIRAQNVSTMRALAWNAALPVAEAGVEEAMAQINTTGITNWASNSWPLSDGNFTKSRDYTNFMWIAKISNTDPPVITSEGYAATLVNGFFAATVGFDPNVLASKYIKRIIRVNTVKNGLFTVAMLAKDTINLNGNNIRTDSFDSSNPLYSTNGLFDPNPAKIRDNGDIATNSGIVNSISIGNADIWGHASTGPGGSVAVGPNGGVGSKSWHTGGNQGIQPGWVRDDMNVIMPDVVAPFSSGFTPASGTVGGTSYTYVLGTGDYVMDSLSLSGQKEMYVSGKAQLVVNSSISMSGQSRIIIGPGASLMIYMKGASASLSGNGVANNTGNAANFGYFGLPTNTSLSLGGNAAFTGVIYAPNANFSLGGGGNDAYDFIGASVTKTVTMNGHFKFHYDENLKNSQWGRGYIPVSWDEI